MSIRTTFLLVFAVLILLLGALAVLTHFAGGDLAALSQSHERRHASYLLADELRQSSDDLTRMARTYVVTGDARFERHFQEILAIRNGEAPRPDRVQGIYWDFVAAREPSPGGPGPAVALERLMRDQGFTEQEFALLREAKSRSDALVALEERAMNAVKGLYRDDATGKYTVRKEPDPVLARSLMHGEEYHAAKSAIMAPIQQFFDRVGERTEGRVAQVRGESEQRGRLALFLALAAAGFALVGLVSLQRKVVSPVQDLARRMDAIAEGERDLTKRVPVARSDDFGRLSRSFNVFVDKIHGSLREVAGATETVSRGSHQIAAATKQQEGAATTFGAATGKIATAGSEISGTSQRLAGTMADVMVNAQDSASAASAGRRGLEGMGETMGGLLRATEGVAERLHAIDQSAEVIVGIVTTMTKVADQANLLSVNAAIEAEKAGASGRGFLVVAREISRLADQTAQATLEIEASIQAMQSAVATGVSDMDTFADRVRRSVTDVTAVTGQLAGVISRVEALTEGVVRVNEGVSQQAEGARSIRESTVALRSGARETLESAGEVARAARTLQSAVGTLHDTVAQFRLEGAPAGPS